MLSTQVYVDGFTGWMMPLAADLQDFHLGIGRAGNFSQRSQLCACACWMLHDPVPLRGQSRCLSWTLAALVLMLLAACRAWARCE